MKSHNLADQLVAGITEMSYRETAAKVNEMTGKRISAMGVWKVIQALGEKVCEEEENLAKAHKSGNVPYKEAVQAIHELLNNKDIDGLFRYLEIYRDSLSDENEIEKAEKLIGYFRNNRKGLLSYQDQGIVLPEHPNGLQYRNMETI